MASKKQGKKAELTPEQLAEAFADADIDYGDEEDVDDDIDEDMVEIDDVPDWTDVFVTKKRKHLMTCQGKKVPVETLNGKYVGLFFSAQWITSAGESIPMITELYNQLHEQKSTPEFEIVFISLDRNLKAYAAHKKDMPWLTVPFGDQVIDLLAEQFQIRTVPALFLFDETGAFVCRQGLTVLEEEGIAGFPWKPSPAPVKHLSALHGRFWQSEPSLVLLAEDNTEAEQKAMLEALQRVAESDKPTIAEAKFDFNTAVAAPVASEAAADAENRSRTLYFFDAFKANNSSKGIRELLALKHTPSIVLLDLLNEGKKYIFPVQGDVAQVKEETIRTFVNQWRNGELQSHLVSEPRPVDDVDPEHPGMHIAVASSLKELVLNEQKVVLLDVWAPQVTHVKLAMEQLALALQEQQAATANIFLCHFDIDNNEIDKHLLPEGAVPIVKLWLPGKKSEPVVYEDYPTATNILDWLNEAIEPLNMEGTKINVDAAVESIKKTHEEGFARYKDKFAAVFDHTTVGSEAPEVKGIDLIQALTEIEEEQSVVEEMAKVIMEKFDEDHVVNKEEWMDVIHDLVVTEGVELNPELLYDTLVQEFSIPACVRAGVCSYTVTEKTPMKQQFYWCTTCTDKPGTGVCQACADVCHNDHQIVSATPLHDEDNKEEEHGHSHSHGGHGHSHGGHGHSHGGHGHSHGGVAWHGHGDEKEEDEDDEKQIDTRTLDCFCDCGAGTLPSKCQIFGKALQ